MTRTDLLHQHCQPLEKGTPPLNGEQIGELLSQLHPDWQQGEDGNTLVRTLKFKDYYRTIAFVNALAWIANREDHHPDLEVSYNRCVVHFSTHSIGGLSRNDFICASRLDALVDTDD